MDRALRRAWTASIAFVAVAVLAAAALWARSDAAATGPDGPVVRAARLSVEPQDAVRPPHEVRLIARKYSFTPSRIEVQENDLVKVTMETADIPHSFTIDDDNYRIAKRATPGHPAVFEFRADKPGTFVFYCNLTTDPNCKTMRGELVVKARK